ncbi:ketoacyl-ACP synthase III [Streptomyces sp. NPDC060184]|uniref:ketoacyl-ACP synthase III n=1 Tax=Streptomyces sp. NPDC060184 TaxID=3347064 RepID=UPI0036546C5E
MTRISLTGFGSHLPGTPLTDDALPPLDAPLTEAQAQRIGVTRRHWAGEHDTVPGMAAAAAEQALHRAGTPAADLDLIVLANWTGRRYIPELAPRLATLLGADRAVAFDLCCACAGFLYGLAITDSLLRTGRYRRALVVASETTSRRAAPGSRASRVYADGAGAFVLQRDAGRGGTLLDHELATDGEQHGIMDVTEDGHVRTHLRQRELAGLAAESIARLTTTLLERNGLSADDVDWFVPHTGTAGIHTAVRRRLPFRPERILTNFSTVGNVSSAAVPVALDHFVSRGLVKPGQLVLSASVGTGWYAAATLYTV